MNLIDNEIEHGLNEFGLMVFNTEKIYKEYLEILKLDKLSRQKIYSRKLL